MSSRVTGDQLRLRRTPGSAGERIARLPANTTLALEGRSADFTWFEVTTANGHRLLVKKRMPKHYHSQLNHQNF